MPTKHIFKPRTLFTGMLVLSMLMAGPHGTVGFALKHPGSPESPHAGPGVSGPVPSPSATPYKSEIQAIDAMSVQLAQQLQSAQISTIFVRHFRGPGTNELQITNLLSQSLESSFSVGPGGAEIEGRVRPLPGAGDGPSSGYRITVSVQTPNDLDLPGVSVDVMNDIEANIKLQESGAVRPQPPKQPGAALEPLRVQKPPIGELIVGNRIYATPGSPYSIEILVQDQYGEFQPRRPFTEHGAIVINLEKGEIYKVRVYNESIYESFANLNIDGLGRFALSHDPRQRRNIDLIKERDSRDFVGYYITTQQAASFMVGSYEDSVAKRVLGDAPDIGTISVAFGCTWEGNNVPAFERETKQVEKVITETINVPVQVLVPRTVFEQVEVPVEVPAKGPVQKTKGFDSEPVPKTRTETRQRTVMEQKTVMRQEQRTHSVVENQVVGTTDGPAVTDNVRTVSRKFGLTRAVIKVRYFASN